MIEIYLAIIVCNWGLNSPFILPKSKHFISFLIALLRIFLNRSVINSEWFVKYMGISSLIHVIGACTRKSLTEFKWYAVYRAFLSLCDFIVFGPYTLQNPRGKNNNSILVPSTFLHEKQWMTWKTSLEGPIESGNLQSYNEQSIERTLVKELMSKLRFWHCCVILCFFTISRQVCFSGTPTTFHSIQSSNISFDLKLSEFS